MARVHQAGLFIGQVHSGERGYKLRARFGGQVVELEDAYRFPPVLSDYDLYLLDEGSHLRSYEKLGAHLTELAHVKGAAFVVFAPNARRVSVVGDFNFWDGRRHAMRVRSGGFWEIFVPGVTAGQKYKFEILGANGALMLKSDPFARAAELRPATASIVIDPRTIDAPAAAPKGANRRDAPISIYEVHLGSWRRHPEDGNRWLTYRELARDLPPYAADLGFTHVEFLPIMEHPFDGSWGYQPTGLYAPTSRFGSPADFAHSLTPATGPGSRSFLTGYRDIFPTIRMGSPVLTAPRSMSTPIQRQGRHLDWDTLIYNFGRREVANFLISNALFWLDCYGIDGLRVDAVASMLYLDYSRPPGDWVPNRHGGRENLEAIEFIRHCNTQVFGHHPNATTMAEESTAWPMVSQPVDVGGLGFGYKWNMGWMHDTLNYVSKEPIHRKHHHGDVLFGLHYAFSENFVLPLSHDEVVHGKRSILGRMPGDRWQRFANLRAYYTFMFGHPGKKLLFMGCEFGQEREWTHDHSLDWHLLRQPEHHGVQALVRDLNRLYRTTAALHELDCVHEGFTWLIADDANQSVFAWLRNGRSPGARCLVVLNFTPEVRRDYRIKVPTAGRWREVFNSDAAIYGGTNVGNAGTVVAAPTSSGGELRLTLPPLAGLMLVPEI